MSWEVNVYVPFKSDTIKLIWYNLWATNTKSKAIKNAVKRSKKNPELLFVVNQSSFYGESQRVVFSGGAELDTVTHIAVEKIIEIEKLEYFVVKDDAWKTYDGTYPLHSLVFDRWLNPRSKWDVPDILSMALWRVVYTNGSFRYYRYDTPVEETHVDELRRTLKEQYKERLGQIFWKGSRYIFDGISVINPLTNESHAAPAHPLIKMSIDKTDLQFVDQFLEDTKVALEFLWKNGNLNREQRDYLKQLADKL